MSEQENDAAKPKSPEGTASTAADEGPGKNVDEGGKDPPGTDVSEKKNEAEGGEDADVLPEKNQRTATAIVGEAGDAPAKSDVKTTMATVEEDAKSDAEVIQEIAPADNKNAPGTSSSTEDVSAKVEGTSDQPIIGKIRLVPLSMLIDTSKPEQRPTRNRRSVISTVIIDSSSSDEVEVVPIARTKAKRTTTVKSKKRYKETSSSEDEPLVHKRATRVAPPLPDVVLDKKFKQKCVVRLKRMDVSKYLEQSNLSEAEKPETASRLSAEALTSDTSPKTTEEDQTNKNTTSTEETATKSSETDKADSPQASCSKNDDEQPSASSVNAIHKDSRHTEKPADSDSTESEPIINMKPTRRGRKAVKRDESDSEAEKKDDKAKASDSDSDVFQTAKSSVARKDKVENNQSGSESSASEEVAGKSNKRIAAQSDSDKDGKGNSDRESSASEKPAKKKKRRIAAQSDSDEENDWKSKSAESNSDSDSSAFEKPVKKRKRIAPSSDSDDDNDSPRKRKNIRKLIKTKDLDDETKRAARQEEDRRKRIEERQKLYNVIYEKKENEELKELVLDFDPDTKEPLLKVDTKLMKLLKPHQAHGVKFMWDACYETLQDCTTQDGSGCILAHCMGLGKTLQIVTLTHTLLANTKKTGVERVLVITPLSTLTNWAREYHQWIKHCKFRDIEVYDMSKFKDKATRIFKLEEWFEEGGVCILGYDMYRILSNDKAKGLKKKQREVVKKSLVDPGPDIVICDEGHLLKNEKTSLSQAVNKMKTRRRIVLTGTPLQNNLKEYYCMIQFIKPNLLGTYKEYLNRFVNPITNGQYTDSTERDTRLMKHRSHILHKLLEGCIQRRDYSVLAPYLPPKHEYVVYVQCSDIQKKLYEFYMTKQRELFVEASNSKGAKLFQDFQNLRRIWTHPMCLRVNSDTVIKKKLMKDDDSEGSLNDFIDDNSESSTSASDSESESESSKKSDKRPVPARNTRNTRVESEEDDVEIVQQEDASEWWMKMVPDENLNNIFCSPKIVLLMTLIRDSTEIGDKILVFSQSLQSLDVIEHFLSLIDAKTRGEEIEGDVGDFSGRWVPDVDYFRLDGSRSVENREAMCKSFNDKTNLRSRLFLISTRAGGLGINLVTANRVVIFDVSWNPSHDTQSIFRVYRFGQDKPCYIYRLIAMGTMEQKVYERQIMKQATAKRVIDEQQISRHYNQNDLMELYTYELNPSSSREIPILPKDRLFAELLSNHEKLIFKYHEHDSLLENEESEHLSEEERKAAWEEYEQEKTRPPTNQYVQANRQAYGNFGNPSGSVTSNKIFGFRTDVLLQLLNMKVGMDNPQCTRDQIVRLVPLYLQRFYAEMNNGDPTLYKDLLDLHKSLEMPQGMYMNPLLYANQAPPSQGMGGLPMQPRNLPSTSETIEILDD